MRLSIPDRDALDPAGQKIWDAISGPRKGLHGPYQMLMHVPPLAESVAQLGAYLRFHGLLPGHVRELAVLAAARTMNVPFEFLMHRPVAEKEGLSKETIENVRLNRFDLLSGTEKLIADIATSICRDRRLSEDLFHAGVAEFGDKQMVELLTLISFYTTIAAIINCFEVDLPEGALNPFAGTGEK